MKQSRTWMVVLADASEQYINAMADAPHSHDDKRVTARARLLELIRDVRVEIRRDDGLAELRQQRRENRLKMRPITQDRPLSEVYAEQDAGAKQ